MRGHPFNAIGADAIVPVTDLSRETRNVLRRERRVDEKEIISAGAGFDEGNAAKVLHSRSTRPSEMAL